MRSSLKRYEITEYRSALAKALATQGLNNQEIADVFQITRENVRKLLARPKSRVKA